MDEKALRELWRSFKAGGDEESRDRLIEHYLPLVKRISERLFYSLAQHVDQEELFSSGLLGLMDSMDRYAPSRQIRFETFAGHRIRGAMLDDVRSRDWAPRLARASQQRYQKTFQELTQDLQRRPTDEEMMGSLGLDPGQFHQLCLEANILNIASLQELSSEEDSSPDQWIPDERHEREEKKRERREFLEKIIRELTEREQQILVMYYFEEMTLKEISRVLSVTEGRISQILSALLCRLREEHLEAVREHI